MLELQAASGLGCLVRGDALCSILPEWERRWWHGLVASAVLLSNGEAALRVIIAEGVPASASPSLVQIIVAMHC